MGLILYGVRRIAPGRAACSAPPIDPDSPGDGMPDYCANTRVHKWALCMTSEALERVIRVHAPALGVAPAAVTVRDTRSRWGSASRAGRLSFSWRLVLAPPRVLETVAVHELAHLRVFGHGPAFWALVATRVPEHKAQRRWLLTHAPELHAALARDSGFRTTDAPALP